MKKLYKILPLLLLLVFTSISSYCQYFTIPDTNFRNYIFSLNSELFTPDKQLIIAKAKNHWGSISCPQQNIKDLSGLQFFHKVTLINCSNNPVTYLPPIDSLSDLTHLYIEFCNLASFPPVNKLSKLQVLNVKGNKLESFPSLSGLQNLNYLDLSENKISNFPDISGLIALQQLYFFNNKISKLPDLKQFVNLQVLDGPGNLLASLPDLSKNTNLLIIRFGGNLLTSLPALNTLGNLKQLYLENNRLVQLPDLSENYQLETLNVASNRLQVFPDISKSGNLKKVFVNNNQLSFSSLIPLTAHIRFKEIFQISPQDTLLNYPFQQLSRNSTGYVFAGVDEKVETNEYSWYKNGAFLTKTNTGYLPISNPRPEDEGYYLASVRNSNPLLSDLTLTVRSARIEVAPCINSSLLSYNMISNSCMKGAEIEVNDFSISSPYKPFVYSLQNSTTKENLKSNSRSFSGIQAGKYNLLVADQSNCSLTLKDFVDIPVATDCDNIITPNGDGVDDTFYIQNSGKMKILSKEGKLIKTINIPGEWDGTDQSGNLVPIGLYTILINDKDKIGVIVLN